MIPSNRDPLEFVHAFSRCVRAMVEFIVWAIIGLIAIAGGYLSVRALLVAIKIVLKALGIGGD
jgi:hypothetical protein